MTFLRLLFLLHFQSLVGTSARLIGTVVRPVGTAMRLTGTCMEAEATLSSRLSICSRMYFSTLLNTTLTLMKEVWLVINQQNKIKHELECVKYSYCAHTVFKEFYKKINSDV